MSRPSKTRRAPRTASAYSIGQQLFTTVWNIALAAVLVAAAFGRSGGKRLVKESSPGRESCTPNHALERIAPYRSWQRRPIGFQEQNMQLTMSEPAGEPHDSAGEGPPLPAVPRMDLWRSRSGLTR